MISNAKIRDENIIPVTPNWNGGVTFEFEYLTDIRTFRAGNEEREAVRDRPRATLEFSFVAADALARQFRADLLSKPNAEWWIGLPWSQSVSSGTILAAGTTFPLAETQWLKVNDWVIVEFVNYLYLRRIVNISGGIVTLNSPIPVQMINPKIYRAVKGFISNRTKVNLPTSNVTSGKISFDVFGDQLDHESGTAQATYLSREVMFKRPNWLDGMELTFSRAMEEIDFDFGRKIRVENNALAETTTRIDIYGMDAESTHDMFGMVSRMMGRRNPFWYPAYEREIIPLTNSARTTATLSIDGDHHSAQRDSGMHRYLLFVFADETFTIRRVNAFNIGVGSTAFTLASSVGSKFDMNTTRVYWLLLRRSFSDSFQFEFMTKDVAKTKLVMRALPISEVE